MDNKSKNILLEERGQSAVEYIMLLAVISLITFSIVNSNKFKDFMGEDSGFFAGLRSQLEYSYRHGYLNSEADRSDDNYSGPHETYYDIDDGRTRFFTGGEQYPR
ncbi:hypothetical protein BIY24_00870 [Halobacteriovorax marinus]|uniref:Exported protein n=2 Tax=Halobacteriovorax marinus TaxID=97084 RepID=E1X2R4_HALMS|nr:hypothetical protein [Halobacteriovorax marinus]ATH06543.1 hypothetical protein BIY24_00870 [Halobacteriovorax marinus]CBW25109.1 putative exported protein [Halobacteriovorax marinus SJ]